MPIEIFHLPDAGEGLTEAEIVRWLVEPGDSVSVNQMVVEIETAKATVELPIPWAGVVSEIHEEIGAIVPVGAQVISIETQAQPSANPSWLATESKKVTHSPAGHVKSQIQSQQQIRTGLPLSH